jgi:hypothetical protein
MPSHRRVDDPAQADRVWAGYHLRAGAPAITIAAVASLIVWTGRWYVEDLSALADRVGALAVFALAWCVWPGLVAVYLYRAATYTYRLTDRAVLVDFGFRYRPVAPVWLRDVTQVTAGGGWMQRVLGVGWVEVRTVGHAVQLVGVRYPELFAERIREAAFEIRNAPLSEIPLQ